MKKMFGLWSMMIGLLVTSLLLVVTCVWAAEINLPEQLKSNLNLIFYPGDWSFATWAAIGFAIYGALSDLIGESNLKENSVIRFVMNLLGALFKAKNKQLLIFFFIGIVFTGVVACATYQTQQTIIETKVIAYEKAGAVLVTAQAIL